MRVICIDLWNTLCRSLNSSGAGYQDILASEGVDPTTVYPFVRDHLMTRRATYDELAVALLRRFGLESRNDLRRQVVESRLRRQEERAIRQQVLAQPPHNGEDGQVHDDLVDRRRRVVHAELRHHRVPAALGGRGVQRQQRRRHVAAERRMAAIAGRRDMAGCAIQLQAVTVGISPPFALVIEYAPRVQAEIPAERRHLTMRRAGYGRGRGGQYRRVPANQPSSVWLISDVASCIEAVAIAAERTGIEMGVTGIPRV